MHHVAVERGKVLVAVREIEQIGAHRHQLAGAARRAVEPADQFLPPRFGSKMQVAGILVGGLRAQAAVLASRQLIAHKLDGRDAAALISNQLDR